MTDKSIESGKKLRRKEAQGVVNSVCAGVSAVENYKREGDYRTVFALGEMERLYVDVEVLNKSFRGADWKGVVTVWIYREEGEKWRCVAEKNAEIAVESDLASVLVGETFAWENLPEEKWRVGNYRIAAGMDGEEQVDTVVTVVEGDGDVAGYFEMGRVFLDRKCEETQEAFEKRPHSFRSFNREGLEDIHLFLMGLNLLERKWMYEFIIRIVRADGTLHAIHRVRSDEFIRQEQEEYAVLGCSVDLGGWSGFVYPGEYTMIVSSFGQVVLRLDYVIGDEDVPYNFEVEIAAKGKKIWALQPTEERHYSVQEKDEVMEQLYRMVGLRKVKEEVTRMVDYAEFVRLRRENGLDDRHPLLHLLFSGNPGTGKHTVAELVGKLYAKLGFLRYGRVACCDRQDLLREGVDSETSVRELLKRCEGGVLFVEKTGDLLQPDEPNDRGMEALAVLFNILLREHPEVLVVLSDTDAEMNVLTQVFPDMKKIFPHHLIFPDYTPEELMEIARKKLEKLQYSFTPEAEEKFFRQLEWDTRMKKADFTNARYVEERIEEATQRMARRLMANRQGEYRKEELMRISGKDVTGMEEKNPGESLKKLKAMVGMGQLKQSIVQHLNYVYFIRERQKHGFGDKMPPLNMIFSGNPETGKMTVAKMIGEIYHTIGILERPNIVVRDGRNPSGEAGMLPQQSAEQVLDAAIGGILYVEHAEALMQSEYGLAWFKGILSGLSVEEFEGTVVILGGLPELMDKLLEMNPSLKNYFPFVFRFNDYTPEELMQIAENKLKQQDFVFHPKARELFAELLRKACEKSEKNFGNVLLVKKIIGMAIRNMSDRTMKIREERELTRQEMTTIRQDDIPVNMFEISRIERDAFDEEGIKNALEQLDQMVGQEAMKQQIRDFVELARHYSKSGVKLSTKMSLQWCITGNSAMGRGTVARIIARLYEAMGIISSSRVVNFKVEKMIGMTEEEAQRSIGEALLESEGGMLFFDEDSPKLQEAVGFQERVRALLMNQMAERPGSYMIIYATPRNRVVSLDGNAEHISELVNVLLFADYTEEELMDILERRLAKENMKMTEVTRKYMEEFIHSLVSTEERRHNSSRLMRIVADMMVRNCLQRMAKKQETGEVSKELTVQKQDVTSFTEQFVATLMNERRRIGFV